MLENINWKQWVNEKAGEQAEITYENYKKIKSFEDIAYFLVTYVVSGGVALRNATRNDTVDVSDIVASIGNDLVVRDGTRFRSDVPNAIYYLDFSKDGDWHWGTIHADGIVGTDYLSIATAWTDALKNVSTIIDTRGPVGGFRLKNGIGIPNLLIDGGDFLDTITYPDFDAGQF